MAGVDGVACCPCCGAPLANGGGVGGLEEGVVDGEARSFSAAVAEEGVRLARVFPGVPEPALGQAAVALAFLRWLEERGGRCSARLRPR